MEQVAGQRNTEGLEALHNKRYLLLFSVKCQDSKNDPDLEG
jgi:hypothetical protein